MRKLIHRYLDEYFHIEKDKVRRNQKYNTFDIPSYVVIKELTLIFGLDKKGLKWYVKSWVRKQSKGFAFNAWWTPVYKQFDSIFPMVSRVAARTVGLDLVQVQPMDAPTGQLVYLDYQVVNNTPQIGELDHAPNEEIVARYATREVNPNYYGRIDVGQPVGVSSRAPILEERTDLSYLRGIREETVRRWQEAGFLDGLNGHMTEDIAELYQAQLQQVIN